MTRQRNIHRGLMSALERTAAGTMGPHHDAAVRDFTDAIGLFANILLYIQRTKSMFQRTMYEYEMIN
ncbi:hypothetical protein CB1_001428074 [Camelus ferus]|nr:hypothetical protein CB1_001428074 [Camelus ferus]